MIRDVAERHGRTAAQVLLRWCVQRDVVAIPKSTRQERIVENGQVFDFALTEQDVAALDGLDRTGDRARPGTALVVTGRATGQRFPASLPG